MGTAEGACWTPKAQAWQSIRTVQLYAVLLLCRCVSYGIVHPLKYNSSRYDIPGNVISYS